MINYVVVVDEKDKLLLGVAKPFTASASTTQNSLALHQHYRRKLLPHHRLRAVPTSVCNHHYAVSDQVPVVKGIQ